MMLGITDKIRKEFLNGDEIIVSELYSKYLVGVDSEKILDVKHSIRSVLNSLSRRNEIIRLGHGKYIKKTLN
jgi:hypothetical protein